MGNQEAYARGLDICKEYGNKAYRIALAIVKEPERANNIKKTAIKEFLETCYYNGLPENEEMALFEKVYEKAINETKEEEQVPQEGNETDACDNKALETKKDAPESVPKDVSDSELKELDKDVKSAENHKEKAGIFSAFPFGKDKSASTTEKPEAAENKKEEKSDRKTEPDTQSLSQENKETASETAEKPQKQDNSSKIRKWIIVAVYVVLALIILWLFFGLLINTGHITPIDIGYSWFNEHFFRAFFLT